MNPLAEVAAYETLRWRRKFRLLHMPNHQLSLLTARCYPTATKERLLLADKFMHLLFALHDEPPAMDELSAILHNRLAVRDNTGINAAFADAWAQLQTISSQPWQQEFQASMQKTFDTAVWAHQNKTQGRLPGIAFFYQKRPYLGIAHPVIQLVPVIENLELPAPLWHDPAVEDLAIFARNALCCAFDLFSLCLEVEEEHAHNIVQVIRRHDHLSVEGAVNQTTQLHNNDMNHFVRISQNHPVFAQHEGSLKQYAAALAAVLRGHIDWSTEDTERYRFTYAGNFKVAKL
jgi:hypothetical protein